MSGEPASAQPGERETPCIFDEPFRGCADLEIADCGPGAPMQSRIIFS
jgi:hypothetical protein